MTDDASERMARRAADRQRWMEWEKRTGKCSACGHSHRMHNELSYCRSNTSHDGSGPCTCGMPNSENRRLHLRNDSN